MTNPKNLVKLMARQPNDIKELYQSIINQDRKGYISMKTDLSPIALNKLKKPNYTIEPINQIGYKTNKNEHTQLCKIGWDF